MAILDALLNWITEKLILPPVNAAVAVQVRWLAMPSLGIEGEGTAYQLRGWVWTIAAVALVAGLLWQAIQMAMSRKGEPLICAVKGLLTTVLWGGIAIGGTVYALKAADQVSCWMLLESLRGARTEPGSPTDPLGHVCTADGVVDQAVETHATWRLGRLLMPFGVGTGLVVLLLVLAVFAPLQAGVLLFRDGALLILTGLVQLAAAGTVARGTSIWLRRIVAWMLALIAYKPVAAAIYAVGFLIMPGRPDSETDIWSPLFGLAIIGLNIAALPALLRLLNWGIGVIRERIGGSRRDPLTAGAALDEPDRPAVTAADAVEHARFVGASLPGHVPRPAPNLERSWPAETDARVDSRVIECPAVAGGAGSPSGAVSPDGAGSRGSTRASTESARVRPGSAAGPVAAPGTATAFAPPSTADARRPHAVDR